MSQKSIFILDIDDCTDEIDMFTNGTLLTVKTFQSSQDLN